MKNKRKLIMSILVIAIGLFGIAYSFFIFYTLGSNQRITAGKINLVFNEGTSAINLSNVFPETVSSARSRADNFITFTISGINTTEDQDIYYEIMINEGTEESGMTRFDPEDLVFDLVELDEDGNEGTYLVDALSYDDFNARRIWVNTILRETSLVVNKTYKLRMWLSDKVLISDSDPKANYPSTGYGNHYASVKVSVYGDFLEKRNPYNYMANLGNPATETQVATFWPDAIHSLKDSITSVKFISMSQDAIDVRYDASSIKADVTDTTKGGSVKAWLENDESNSGYYIMYVASDGMTFLPSDCTRMLYSFANLQSILLENINTKNVTIMNRMFASCRKLTSLTLKGFDTNQATDVSYMFSNGSSLVSLDLGNFDTSHATNMTYMFNNCGSLTELDLSSFDTSQVTNMAYMFNVCSGLIKLDLSNFDTGNVTTMYGMFSGCTNLVSLDVKSFNTSKVTDLGGFVNDCPSLIRIDLSSFNTNQVTSMRQMFRNCSSLTVLNLSNFNVNSVNIMKEMFYNCNNLTTIIANTDWNTTNVTDSSNMFYGCTKLVGSISYNSSKTNVLYANPTTGYFTTKIV